MRWERHPDAVARGQTGNLFEWNGTPAIVFPHPDGGGASCFAGNPEGDLERWQFDPRSAVLRHPVQGNSLYPSNNDVTARQEGEWCYVTPAPAISSMAATRSYHDRRFHPESFDRINWPGGNLHAPRAMLDGQGRPYHVRQPQ